MKFREELRQDREWVGDSAAINARMQIALGSGQFDLVIIQATQAVSNRRNALAKHGSIGDDESVGFELCFVLLDKIPEADAADFFFTFDEDLYIDGELAVHFLERFKRFQVNVDLAFVVSRTAAEKIAVTNGGLEGGRGPEIERFGGLHVIVPIKKNGWLAGSFQRFRVNERVEGSGNDLYMLETSSAKIAGNPVRAALDIRFVLALGADAGDTQ